MLKDIFFTSFSTFDVAGGKIALSENSKHNGKELFEFKPTCYKLVQLSSPDTFKYQNVFSISGYLDCKIVLPYYVKCTLHLVQIATPLLEEYVIYLQHSARSFQ